MKKAIIISLLSTLMPVSAFAGGESLVSVFENYCLKHSDNSQTLDRAISKRTDDEQAKYDKIRGQGDNGYMMTLDGHPYLIEWIGEACRVSTNGVFPNDVMKALATNHMLSKSHGDKTDFGRALWFESGHVLTRFAFTHDLNHSTILLEYQKDDATNISPVAITYTR
ncbi:MAG: hypothetical protein SFU55_09885 [Methylophilus sp.]|nr:hypothetical protein [Methylophilus sp.]